jgi:cobyrinic acid a,c-diamide synthase
MPLALASDAAFHFRYPETAELLRGVGFDPQPWSPLADAALPPQSRAVLLPGGYPELHAEQLAGCRRSLAGLAEAAGKGLPIVAECGGLLVLGSSLEDAAGIPRPMAGVLPFSASRGALSLGYREACVASDGLLVRRGETYRGHEFHRWQLRPTGAPPAVGLVDRATGPAASLWQLEGWGSPARLEGWSRPHLHASWLHLHWAGCPELVRRLGAAARAPLGSAGKPLALQD